MATAAARCGFACALAVSLFVASCTRERITSVGVASVTVVPSSANLLVGDNIQLTATVQDDRGQTHASAEVAWTSPDSLVARVSPTGRVDARSAGTVEVLATFRGESGSSMVRVFPAPLLAVSRSTVPMIAAERGTPPEAELVSVSNVGAGQIEGLTATVAYDPGGATGWLRAALAAPSAPTVLTLEAEPGTLPTGVHRATVSLSSPDAGNSPVDVAVTLTISGYAVIESGGSTTVSESGTTDAFTVVLTSQPSSNVVLGVVSSDAGEAAVAPSALTFTPANWSTPQTVTATGIDDPVVDGDQVSIVRVSVNDASSDDAFDALADRTLLVTTGDDDQSGFAVSESAGSTAVSESGTTDAFTVVLTTQPASNVVFNVTGSDATEATASPSTLAFTPASWNTPQSVTITGVDDGLSDGDQISSVRVSVNAAASDDAFDVLPDRTVSVTTSDDDQAGFIVAETGGSTTASEGGRADTLTVVLTTQPATNVVLAIVSSNTAEATVAPSTQRFTPTNWSTPQTVTVTGVDDMLVDGDGVTTIRVSVDDGASDDAFDPLPDRTVQVTTVDNDQAGFTVAESGGSTAVTEGGATDALTVVLNRQPTSNVVLSVAASDVTEATASPSTLTFTPADWSAAQTVTITGVDDNVVDGGQVSTVRVSVNDAASDDAFDPLADRTVPVTTTDNDAGGFTVIESGGSTAVSEAGTTDAFTVVLTAQPLTNVTLAVVASDAGEATASPSALTFTPANWSTAQTVTVTGVEDPVVDGTQISAVRVSVNDAASDDAFDPLADRTVSVTTTDNDQAGLLVTESGGSTSVSEAGATDAFTVVLTTQPATNVVLSVVGSDATEATASPPSLTFTPANWSNAQAVTITGVDDMLVDGNQISDVRVSVVDASSDDAFDPLPDAVVSVTTIDNDQAGLTIAESGGSTSVSEAGTSDAFTIVLSRQPASDVVLGVVASDLTEATVSPASVTFTPANWSTPQTVGVTGVDDQLIDGPQTSTVTVSVNDAASDDAFDPLADRTVAVTTADNDAAGFDVTQTGGTTAVSEAGTTDAFTVVLTTQPTTNVVVGVGASDETEATAAPATLTFTSANWNAPQTVTVTGVDDAVVDGAQTSTITVSVNDAASDDAFDGLADRPVTVTTADNDAAGFSVVQTDGTTVVSEAGTTDALAVVLTAQPTTDVVLSVSSSDGTEATAAPGSLTFTSASWSTPQTVTVTGVDDQVIDGAQASTVTVSVSDAASDDAFDPLADGTVTVTTTDNDAAGFAVTESGGSTAVSEGGATDAFSVVLTTQPAADVVFNVTASDASEAAAGPASLRFTSANWSTPQTVTVTGVDDLLLDGAQTSTVTVSVNDPASDDAFDPLADLRVTVTTADNEPPLPLPAVQAQETGGGTRTTESGGTDSFAVALLAPPARDVVLTVTSGNLLEVLVTSFPVMTFTPSDWDSPQTVTVAGVDDILPDGDSVVPVTVAVSSLLSDPAYADLSDVVRVTNADNDGL